MKIIKLNAASIDKVRAHVNKKRGTGEKYLSIKHGSSGFWIYYIMLSKNFFTLENEEDPLELKGDDYVLKPIKKNGNVIKDSKGNIVYCLEKDYMENHKKDNLVFWEIPNKYYTNVKHEISGMAKEIAVGIVGKERDGVAFSSPAPIIEVLGDCVLSWTGKNEHGDTIQQYIKYDYMSNTWDIGVVEKKDVKCMTQE